MGRQGISSMSNVEKALRAIMLWRLNVNTSPNQIMAGLDYEGIAVALFNGPIWDDAEQALDAMEARMNIRATRFYNGEWIAVDDDTYDGAEDSKSPCGVGSTEQEAIDDLLDKMNDSHR